MLVAHHFDGRTLPDDDLVYAAFRVCYFDLFTWLETETVLGESDLDDGAEGYLTSVPFFRSVPPLTQLNLLAEVWTRHRSPAEHSATMVDAAVIWSVLNSAGPIARRTWDGNLDLVLRGGPRPVSLRLTESVEHLWQTFYNRFWDSSEFLTFDEQLDLPPQESRALRESLGISGEWSEGMFAVLDRSPTARNLLNNLTGLLTDDEIVDHKDVWTADSECE